MKTICETCFSTQRLDKTQDLIKAVDVLAPDVAKCDYCHEPAKYSFKQFINGKWR
jgi:hypothetical protein